MTFQVTVKNAKGEPLSNCLVIANDETDGASFSRGTDGSGYADVDVKATPVGRQMTLSVQNPRYVNHIEYPVTTADNQVIEVVLDSFNIPSRIAPRFWKGNMCGVRIQGLSDVGTGGPIDLVLSWFYPFYPPNEREIIRSVWMEKGLVDVVLSWADAKSKGMSENQFGAICVELMEEDFYPCPFLFSKDIDIWHDPQKLLDESEEIRAVLQAINIPRLCIFWEGSLWMTKEEAQILIDAIAPDFVAIDTKVYIHMQEGYIHFGQETIAEFWHRQVGKLTGILYQKRLSEDKDKFLDSISDCLQRFCGGWGMPSDSGFDHPFDMIALELNAMNQFLHNEPESMGVYWGDVAMNAPHCFGPDGTEAYIMGRGNG